jgi:hypothetical protein
MGRMKEQLRLSRFRVLVCVSCAMVSIVMMQHIHAARIVFKNKANQDAYKWATKVCAQSRNL